MTMLRASDIELALPGTGIKANSLTPFQRNDDGPKPSRWRPSGVVSTKACVRHRLFVLVT